MHLRTSLPVENRSWSHLLLTSFRPQGVGICLQTATILLKRLSLFIRSCDHTDQWLLALVSIMLPHSLQDCERSVGKIITWVGCWEYIFINEKVGLPFKLRKLFLHTKAHTKKCMEGTDANQNPKSARLEFATTVVLNGMQGHLEHLRSPLTLPPDFKPQACTEVWARKLEEVPAGAWHCTYDPLIMGAMLCMLLGGINTLFFCQNMCTLFLP